MVLRPIFFADIQLFPYMLDGIEIGGLNRPNIFY
jgi:hypothetical protein